MHNKPNRLDNGLGPKLSSNHLAFILFNIFNFYEAEVFLYLFSYFLVLLYIYFEIFMFLIFCWSDFKISIYFRFFNKISSVGCYEVVTSKYVSMPNIILLAL